MLSENFKLYSICERSPCISVVLGAALGPAHAGGPGVALVHEVVAAGAG